MTVSLKQIQAQALTLDAEDRAKLVDVMLQSLSEPRPEISEAWSEEIERRVAAFDRGEIATRPAEDVFAEAKRIGK
ncbi:MAG: addiction module protein [Acidobacteria bacterium]|nr:addiction module protein [Acidobacteriota bacterium]